MNPNQEWVNQTPPPRFILVIVSTLFFFLISAALWDSLRGKEVALKLGEPWEDMRERSSARIDPATSQYFVGTLLKFNARLRLVDPQYGFVTPVGRNLSVSLGPGQTVGHSSLELHTEHLLLDDAWEILRDMQEQWRNAGWTPFNIGPFPPFAETPDEYAKLKYGNRRGNFYWRAADEYEVKLGIHGFESSERPGEIRYRLRLQLSEWRERG